MKDIMMSQVMLDVAMALKEDVGSGDITALLLDEKTRAEACIITRESMTLCGLAWAEQAFTMLSSELRIQWHHREGKHLSAGDNLCSIEGPVRAILTAERTALNFLQTLSATATATSVFVKQLEPYATKLLDTRKTLPGLRYAQKYAVACGGGVNHRHGLYDAFLIKENHIAACGSIGKAIERAKQLQLHCCVEVEVENLTEYSQALDAGPDVIMLDNFSLIDMQEAVSMRGDSAVKLEGSGNVNLASIAQIAATGVDYVSVGGITKNIHAIDLSLRLQ